MTTKSTGHWAKGKAYRGDIMKRIVLTVLGILFLSTPGISAKRAFTIMDLYKKGMISAEESYAKANEKARFRPLLTAPPADFTEA